MRTEILHHRDCLIRQVPSFRRSHPHHATNHNPNPHHPQPFKKRRPSTSRPARNGAVTVAVAGGRFAMGQVAILKRGESLSPASKKAIESLMSDPKLFGPGRLGPDPDLAAYAGSAFSTSPPPGSLPLPRFSRREEVWGVHVDHSATKDLRLLLGLI